MDIRFILLMCCNIFFVFEYLEYKVFVVLQMLCNVFVDFLSKVNVVFNEYGVYRLIRFLLFDRLLLDLYFLDRVDDLLKF